MTFDHTRIADPRYFAENRMPAHSDHRWHADAAEAALGVSSYEQSLNGLWKFHYAKNFTQLVDGFEQPDFDCSGWDDIPVPSHIQLQGYDRPQYVNTQYPWDGLEDIEPGQLPQRYNPVGSYVRTFTLDQAPAAGERVSVVFNGAESAIAVWLNGRYIGYATDSFTPSEFDLTDALVAGENKLAAQVFRWSAGSWIEDQDFFRFSGLFRDVVLRRRPVCHGEDVALGCTLADDLASAEVNLRVRLLGAGSVRARIEGVGELTDAGGGEFTARIDAPRLWSSEDPHLYDVTLTVADEAGRLVEHIPLRLGVRRFGIEDGVLKINGQRIVFKGVNRHEFGLDGRVMTRERTEADLVIAKAAGINAIRTSHYPNNSFFYELCDEYGLYVIDEMNLESHGSWDALNRGQIGVDEVIPGDRPEWAPTLLDRAESMLARDKNHACVVMWSCGNESFGGTGILAVSNYFRRADPSRPVHYEGVQWDPRHPETSDVVSQMYTPAAEVEAYLAQHRDKPFILCEYAHSMGNSFGAVDKYLDLAYRDPLFQGGFIWDFADQALVRRDRFGAQYFGYGGDFGDTPSDLDFCGNGILFADHTPKPQLAEVKYQYQGLRVEVSPQAGTVQIENRMLFTDSDAYDCVATLAQEGRVLSQGGLETRVPPGQTQTCSLPVELPQHPGEYTVDVSFRLRTATAWAPAGYEVAWGQGVARVGEPARARSCPAPELIRGTNNFGVRGPHFTALFERGPQGLESYRYGLTPDGGRELLRGTPRPNFWHAPTSNERGWNMPARDGAWLLASLYPRLRAEPVATANPDSVDVRYEYALATAPESECDLTYRVFGDGRVEVTLAVRPGAGTTDMPEFGLLLATDPGLRRLTWYGEGPEECYVDRRTGVRLGVHHSDVSRELTPYLRPQEAGNRTGVRWATVTDDQGAGLRFECAADSPDGMEFSALPWTPFEVEHATHHCELPASARTVIRPALMRRGVGGDQAWGAETHPEYRLPKTPLTFRFSFCGVR